MPRARDPDAQIVVFTLDASARQDFKQLRVQRAAVNLKDQFGNARPLKEDAHDGSTDDTFGMATPNHAGL